MPAGAANAADRAWRRRRLRRCRDGRARRRRAAARNGAPHPPPRGRNAVPTTGPVADVSSAAPAASAAARSTGKPDAAAIAAAVILVAMPPRPSPLSALATVTASTSVGASTSRSSRAVGCADRRRRGRRRRRAARARPRRRARDERCEAVVVAHPDLVGGDGVVLVDHGQHVEPEQALQRALRVAVVGAADHVVGGEQHLPDGLPVAGERPRVGLGEQELADRGRGLLGGEVAGSAGQPERREPGRDRPRGDEHHLAARGAPFGERVDQRVEAGRVEPARQRGERRRPHLHDDAPRRCEGRAGHSPTTAHDRREPHAGTARADSRAGMCQARR